MLSTLVMVASFFGFGALHLGIWKRLLFAWDSGAGLYLVLAWHLMFSGSYEGMRWRARIQDDGAAVVLFLTVLGALASLAGLALELVGLKSHALAGQSLALGGLTFLISWLMVHTTFALHYAHAYYATHGAHPAKVLEFPGEDPPAYVDFLYFSMVLGMTSQTADVAIASTRMRRLVMTHGMIAFLFNTTLLALTINIAAGLLG